MADIGAELSQVEVPVHSNSSNYNYTGKSLRSVWWNSHASRWDGLFPYVDAGASEDSYIWKDIDGNISNAVGPSGSKIELDDRNTGRPTIYWDDTNKKLYVYSIHDTDPETWVISYNSTTDEYSFITGKGSAQAGVSGGGLSRDADIKPSADEGFGLTKTPNGVLWAANCQNGSYQLQWTYSTDDGETWATAATIATKADYACVDVGWYTYNGTSYVFITGSENGSGGTGGREVFFYYMDQDGHTTPGTWTNDTNVPSQWKTNQESDDHICMCRDSNHTIHIVCKSEGTDLNDTYILSREADGTWKDFLLLWEEGQAGFPDPTRPSIATAIIDGVEVLVTCATRTGGNTTSFYKICTTDHNFIEPGIGTQLMLDDTLSDVFDDAAVPQFDFTATPTTGLLVIEDDQTDKTIWQHNIDFSYLSLVDTSLQSQAATITASVSIGWKFNMSPGFESQAASISGSGYVTHISSSAALTADAATVVGVGVRGSIDTTPPALTAQASVLSGAGYITHSGSGTLTAQAAAIVGTGYITHTGIGALVADVAQVAGIGYSGKVGSGTLACDYADIVAAVTVSRIGSGALQAGASQITASVAIGRFVLGALQADASQISGSGYITKNISVTLQVDPATVSADVTIGRTGAGTLTSDVAQLSGSGWTATVYGPAPWSSGSVQIVGAGFITKKITANLQSQSVTIDATHQIGRHGSGTLVSDPATINATVGLTYSGTGILVSQEASITCLVFIGDYGTEQLHEDIYLMQELIVDVTI